MGKIGLGLLMAILAFGLITVDAQAKRFGGGGSFGTKHEVSSFSRPHKTVAASAVTAAKPATAAAASGASKWLGPLAGLAAGGLLASLFMGNGLGTGIISWLLMAAGIFLAWRLMQALFFKQTAMQPQAANFQPQPLASAFNAPFSPNMSAVAANSASETVDERLKNFDEAAFLRQAKSLFIRLQAAYDDKNLTDIHVFTAPAVFAEIQLQLQERGDAVNFTEVVSVDAELVNLTTDPQGIISSVLFSGLIREQQGAAPNPVKEIWNFYNDEIKRNWLVVGIQQA